MVTVRKVPTWCVVIHTYGHGMSSECQIQTTTVMGAIAEVLSYMTPEEQAAVDTVVVTRLYSLNEATLPGSTAGLNVFGEQVEDA